MHPQLKQKTSRAAGVSPGKTPCCYFAERCRSSCAVGRCVGPSYTTDGDGNVAQATSCERYNGVGHAWLVHCRRLPLLSNFKILVVKLTLEGVVDVTYSMTRYLEYFMNTSVELCYKETIFNIIIVGCYRDKLLR